jgi:phage/plasmid-like protein (TIGR03299 family)
MPHNVETMAFAGQLPWHGLGTALEEADLYDWQSASRKAGLDWEAERVPLLTADKQERVARYAVRRKSDGRILGTVGSKYTLLQNKDAFGWFTPFLEAREAALHTAGSLAEGSRIWVLAKLNREPLVIAEGDEVEKFILLSHSHDGSLAVRVGFTPIRVVCQNTLSMAHGSDASKLIRVKHSRSVHENLTNIQQVMNLANQEFEATAEQYKLLARREINQVDLRKYVRRVFKLDEADEVSSRMSNILDEVVGLAKAGVGNDLPSVRGTYWAAYNGVSEYLTYQHGRNESNRLNSLWFGENANVNRHALDTAVQMALAA